MAGMQPPSQRPPIVDAFASTAPYASPHATTVHWGAALTFGLGAAFLGGIVWGVIAAVAGYIFLWGGIIIGVFVAWAMDKGAGRVTGGLIGAAALLTFLSVVIGDITALSIIGASIGISPADIIAHYPQILALAPGEAALTYIFGAIGIAASVYFLWTKMKAERTPKLWAPYPPPLAIPYIASPAGMPAAPPAAPPVGPPVVEDTSRRGTAGVRVRIRTTPEHVLEATYRTLTGLAVVTVDGRPFSQTRIWGPEDSVMATVGGNPPQRAARLHQFTAIA